MNDHVLPDESCKPASDGCLPPAGDSPRAIDYICSTILFTLSELHPKFWR